MIYLVSKQQELFRSLDFSAITPEYSLKLMENWNVVQMDTETSGRDPHLCSLLCIQFGNDSDDVRIVVDTSTIDVHLYKEVLESKRLIVQNGKFDLQFLYNYGIIPRKIYDTMIVEQLLHLGYPAGQVSYSLKEIAWRRLSINIDKSVRGQIIWRGLDHDVIVYAAGDVTFLEQIMHSQLADLKKLGLMKAAKIECDFVPVIAYLEWCGIHLDQDKWKAKMQNDEKLLGESKKALDTFVENMVSLDSRANKVEFEETFLISIDGYGGHEERPLPQGARIVPNSEWSVSSSDTNTYNYVKIVRKFPFCEINLQGDLFAGFDTSPHCIINWNSSAQVVKFAKFLGFDTHVKDKKTGEDKESVLEKHLKSQKGICDEFLKLYFDYQEHFKVVTSFGQGHLNAVNPKTDRIHTVFRQLGAASGRMSCGSQQPNTDLAKIKQVRPSECTYPNIQQLPSDEVTRACFTAPEGYLWSSCDYSALESRLGADIYDEKSMLNEFLHGSGDMHSLCAYMVYKDEIPRDTPIKDIKKKYPHLRKAVKPIELNCEDS